jgi:hypothetical protein
LRYGSRVTRSMRARFVRQYGDYRRVASGPLRRTNYPNDLFAASIHAAPLPLLRLRIRAVNGFSIYDKHWV